MKQINTYTPTENISPRNIDTYYTAIKEFLINHDANGIILNIVPDDSTHTLTITAAESYLNTFVIKITITATEFVISSNAADGNKTRYYDAIRYNHNGFAKNIPLHICINNDEFTLGADTLAFCFGVFTASSFSGNGNRKKILMTVYYAYGAHLCLCINNPTYHLVHSEAYHRSSFGLSGTYRFIQYPISGTDLLADHIYFADGGTSNPPSRFSVGNDEYLGLCPECTNLCFKLGEYNNDDENESNKELEELNLLVNNLNNALEITLDGGDND